MKSNQLFSAGGPGVTTLKLACVSAAVLALAGCLATTPTAGGAGTVASGSAGGESAQGANSTLEKCTESLGTLGIDEDQNAPWYAYYSQQYKLGSTVPLLRLIIQQSNCFVIVERGSSFNNVMRERQLRDSGEMRAGSNMQQGQIVAADYTMKPNITFSEKTGGAGAAIGGLFGSVGALIGGSISNNEAATTLIMIDNRSGVQLAAAEGSAKNMDFGFMGGLFGGSAGGVGGAYSRTPEGKVITAAFVDSYNNLVKAVRNYKAQTVRGGLGTGGRLGVQGGSTPASNEVSSQPAPASTTAPPTPKPAAPAPATKKPPVKK
jgi:curli biogenesis system outer membrane secretion channel CsgG